MKWEKYPVTNEEALELINLIKSQNDKNALSKLVVKLSYLVQSRIKNHNGKYFYDDLLQEGRIGIIKAVEDFDLERSKNFFKFAVWHIQTKVRRFIDKEIKQTTIAIIKKQDTESLEDDVENQEISYIINKSLNTLPLRDKIILKNRFGVNSTQQPKTLEEIGIFLGISKERVRQLESKALLKLKNNKNIQNLYNE